MLVSLSVVVTCPECLELCAYDQGLCPSRMLISAISTAIIVIDIITATPNTCRMCHIGYPPLGMPSLCPVC